MACFFSFSRMQNDVKLPLENRRLYVCHSSFFCAYAHVPFTPLLSPPLPPLPSLPSPPLPSPPLPSPPLPSPPLPSPPLPSPLCSYKHVFDGLRRVTVEGKFNDIISIKKVRLGSIPYAPVPNSKQRVSSSYGLGLPSTSQGQC